jgi:hypothetical protein
MHEDGHDVPVSFHVTATFLRSVNFTSPELITNFIVSVPITFLLMLNYTTAGGLATLMLDERDILYGV